ncbi:hypothetical protein ABZ249_31470 [Nocardiopsis sp. NPDC006139]|uniref:DUF6225 family protein n=1 Tax=Nocardiopsis sp. NPDC006139 TaxID=3154578 RepID=UPI0033B7C437
MSADRPLTAGDLRALLADLPDDTPLRASVIDGEDPDIIEHLVVVRAAVDRLTFRWGAPSGLTHQGRPYLLLDARHSTEAEQREISDPATTEDA